MCGFSEQLEFLRRANDKSITRMLLKGGAGDLRLLCGHASVADGVPYWDTAPHLHHRGDWQVKPPDPFNDFEPVNSSVVVIAAQGLLRLGRYMKPLSPGAFKHTRHDSR